MPRIWKSDYHRNTANYRGPHGKAPTNYEPVSGRLFRQVVIQECEGLFCFFSEDKTSMQQGSEGRRQKKELLIHPYSTPSSLPHPLQIFRDLLSKIESPTLNDKLVAINRAHILALQLTDAKEVGWREESERRKRREVEGEFS